MTSHYTEPLATFMVSNGINADRARDYISSLRIREYHHREVIFRAGDRHPIMVYIITGNIRTYGTDEGGEQWIRHLAGPGEFCGNMITILQNAGSDETAECIGHCRLIVMERHNCRRLLENRDFKIKVQQIVIDKLLAIARERSEFLPLKARERYELFRERYPALALTVPERDIASYIGIRPQSLSRIKKDYLNRQELTNVNGHS